MVHPKCLNIKKIDNKLWYSHTIEHYSKIKKKKKWIAEAHQNMDLKVMLREKKSKRIWLQFY